MSHRKKRSNPTPERTTLTYADLRAIAAERRNAKRGVSRRDFLLAGSAAAVAAASSGEAFAAEPYPRGAFDQCMTEVRTGAKPLMLSADAESAFETHGLRMFTKQNEPIWNANSEKVLSASRAIGRVSAALADINNEPKIGYAHAKEAVAVVKKFCGVGAQPQPRFRFCPDMP